MLCLCRQWGTVVVSQRGVVQHCVVVALTSVPATSPASASRMKAYKAGIRAALWSRNDRVSIDLTAELIETRPGSTETEVPAAINETMTRNYSQGHECGTPWRQHLLPSIALPHCAAVPHPTAAQVLTPKLLVLRVTDSPVSKDAVNGINAGLNASLWSRNFNVADGIRIEIVTKETTVAAVSDTVDKALTEDPNILALRGPFGDETLIDVLPVLSKHGAVAFSPVTGSTTARVWSPNVYFIRVEPAAELRALLWYAIGHLRVRRLGFMYLQKVSYGEEEYKEAVQIMSGMGYELSGVFTMSGLSDKSPKDPVFEAAWEKFAETRPQAVIVFGVPSALTEEFIMRMLTDRRTAGAYLLGRTDVQELMLRVWRQAVEKGVPFVSGQVITTGTSPLAKETRYAAIKRFQIEMEKYLQDSGQSIYKDPKQFLINDEDGERMVSGWIAGEVLMRAMGIPEWVKDRSTFVKSLFNQRRYLIDDLLIGDYGGECSDVSASHGAMCYCNQGGRTVYMKRFVKDYRAEGLDDGVLRMLQCNASGVKLPPPVNAVTLMMTDSSVAVSGTVELGKAFDAALQFSNIATARSPFTMQTINSTLALAPSVLRKEIQEKHIHGVGGFVTLDLLDVPNVTFIDPLFLQPRLNKFRRHVIHLSPTVEQELLVLAFYLGNWRVIFMMGLYVIFTFF
ncbi:Leucine-binding protein domain [Trypanosoma melophagium]|uniref:Leucine-binding protein domain n=1 Tax=Trypanosoma melophagium TaxID=715481 RepID=UPI00351A8288|nr:Leucine-binding protein domain [Trypanosoma melophagium]